MDTQQAIDFLFGLLVEHHHSSVKLEALEVLHNLKAKFPHLTISGKRIVPFLMEEADLYKDTLALSYAAQNSRNIQDEEPAITVARTELIHLIERKLDTNLKRIFWILGLSYPPGVILPLYRDLRHQDQNIRISTVELLDNVLEPGLKKAVFSIMETAMLDSLSKEDLARLELEMHTEASCYHALLSGKDDQIKLAVLTLIRALKSPELDHLLEVAEIDEHTHLLLRAEKLMAKERAS
jgi:AAA family ATP:ADP antiporter